MIFELINTNLYNILFLKLDILIKVSPVLRPFFFFFFFFFVLFLVFDH